MCAMDAAGKAFEESRFIAAKRLLEASCTDSTLTGVAASAAERRFTHNRALLDYLSHCGSRCPDKLLVILDELDDDDSANSVERAVLRYNRAILRVQLRRYSEALNLLHPLLALKEIIEINVSIKIAMLLLDILLILKNENLANSVLQDLHQLHKIRSDSVKKCSTQTSDAELSSTRSMPLVELSFWIHIYSARVMILAGDSKNAKKEVKCALQICNKESNPTTTSCDDIPILGNVHKASAFMLKAQLEAHRDNPCKALKLLNNVKSCFCDDESVSAVYLCNLGTLHYQMTRYSAAILYTSKAITASLSALSNATRTEGVFLAPNLAHIFMNIGLQLIESSSFNDALHFLRQSSTAYPIALIWLRKAESCIALYTEWYTESSSTSDSMKLTRPSAPKHFQFVAIPDIPISIRRYLLDAIVYYQNAFCLADKDDDKELHNASIAGLGFALLRLGRYRQALTILQLYSGSSLRAHCTMYSTEAYCRVGDFEEAVNILQDTEFIENSDPDLKADLYTNLCTAYCAKEEFELALRCSLQACACNAAPSLLALRGLCYVLLQLGRPGDVVFVAQRHCVPPTLVEEYRPVAAVISDTTIS